MVSTSGGANAERFPIYAADGAFDSHDEAAEQARDRLLDALERLLSD
jgi:hypothetical protein